MAILASTRKSKKFKKVDVEDHRQKFCGSFLCRVLSNIPVTLLLLFIIFLWSSSSTFISGSVVHVCVSSRKLYNLYCLSAGTQPANYSIPLLPHNDSKVPVFETGTQQPHSASTKLLLNETQKIPVSSLNNPSIPQPQEQQQNPPNVDSAKAGSKESQMYAALTPSNKEVVSSLNSPPTPIEENSSVRDGNTSFSLFTNPVLRRGIDKAKAEEIASARKHVEEHLVILRSYIPKSKPSDCDGRGIYVYDLPPKFNKDLVSRCHDMITWLDFCKHLSHDGMGEPIPKLGKDWYNTHQYSLEPVFHSHVLKHPCRVHNWEEAKLFFVPFYGGLDILRWHFKNVSNEVKDMLSNELVEWLEEQKPWKRHFGMDHVFVLGKISWDFRRLENGSWGTRLLELDKMQHPIKLMIERKPWEANDVGVPHPTYFHPSSDEAILEWQSKIRGVHRRHLVSFAGTPRWPPKGIRSVLIEQCTSSPNTCKFFDCRDQACVKPAPIVRLFTESEFCLQPPGDSPTRKSVFDSLVAGCIPVVFDPFTAHYQYPWHLPQDYRKYSVFIDQEEVKMSEVNVIEKLMKIPLKEREQMRKYIIDELMPRLVYSHPNAKLQRFEDAFSVAVNSLLEMAASKLP